jgi:hypothetical protein
MRHGMLDLETAGAATCRGTQGPCGAVHDVSRCGTVYGADLGCSSSYSIGRLMLCLRTGVWSRLPCQQQLNTDESVVSQVPDARVWEKAGCYSQAWRTENRSKIPIRRVVEPVKYEGDDPRGLSSFHSLVTSKPYRRIPAGLNLEWRAGTMCSLRWCPYCLMKYRWAITSRC